MQVKTIQGMQEPAPHPGTKMEPENFAYETLSPMLELSCTRQILHPIPGFFALQCALFRRLQRNGANVVCQCSIPMWKHEQILLCISMMFKKYCNLVQMILQKSMNCIIGWMSLHNVVLHFQHMKFGSTVIFRDTAVFRCCVGKLAALYQNKGTFFGRERR